MYAKSTSYVLAGFVFFPRAELWLAISFEDVSGARVWEKSARCPAISFRIDAKLTPVGYYVSCVNRRDRSYCSFVCKGRRVKRNNVVCFNANDIRRISEMWDARFSTCRAAATTRYVQVLEFLSLSNNHIRSRIVLIIWYYLNRSRVVTKVAVKGDSPSRGTTPNTPRQSIPFTGVINLKRSASAENFVIQYINGAKARAAQKDPLSVAPLRVPLRAFNFDSRLVARIPISLALSLSFPLFFSPPLKDTSAPRFPLIIHFIHVGSVHLHSLQPLWDAWRHVLQDSRPSSLPRFSLCYSPRRPVTFVSINAMSAVDLPRAPFYCLCLSRTPTRIRKT